VSIVRDGHLCLNLYHGTSSINLASIQEHGLGARNPVTELDVLNFLRRTYELTQTQIPAELSAKPILKSGVETMIGQGVSGGGMNYRHGGTYLSPSCQTAMRYARSSPEGSELITQAHELFLLLSLHAPEAAEAIKLDYPNLLTRFDNPGKPILLHLAGLRTDQLRSENGGTASQTIVKIERMLANFPATEKNIDIICQQTNFELIGSVPADRITITELAPL